MTTRATQRATRESASWRIPATLLLVATLVAGAALPARAQEAVPEVGGAERYQPAKTVSDYEAAEMAENARKSGDFDYAKVPLRVEVWTDRAADEIYGKGDDIDISFETNMDAYAVVYRIDTEGLVTVLWPRSRYDDGFVFGGHEYKLPVSGGRGLRVGYTEGQGLVEALVSQYPFDLRALEIDFHHERSDDRRDFHVAGDPFLAMNEVNYAVTGLENTEEYVVTNYAGYYVHRAVDHPRYLCNQCHVDEPVAYDPYGDDCTLNIEVDYSWYNGWYDNYGYYPVYGNPVYVYIDPWTWSPWVNYWYRPWYTSAPWYDWGWGWGHSYSWHHSPYYWGDCYTAYSGGHRRYRPLDRTRYAAWDGSKSKVREYDRGSPMVRNRAVSDSKRDAMRSRTRLDVARGGDGRSDYRGENMRLRERTDFAPAVRGGRGGLRIRENVRTEGRSGQVTGSRRHTSAGEGRSPVLAPVTRERNENWRGTTRVGGRSSTPSAVGNSRGTLRSGGGSTTIQGDSRSRSSGTKSVQPRKRSTRVWNATGGNRSGSDESIRSRGGSSGSRDRGSNIDRSRSGGSSRDRGTKVDRGRSGSSRDKGTKVDKGRSGGSRNKGTKIDRSSKRSSGSKRETVKPRSNRSSSRSTPTVKNNSSSRSSSSKSSGSSRSGGSRSGGSKSGSRDGGSRKR